MSDYPTGRHEAAHALAAHLLGHRVESVSTRPAPGEGGHCHWAPGPAAADAALADRAAIVLAPRAAFRHHAGDREWSYEHDDAQLRAYAARACGPDPTAQAAFTTAAYARACALMDAHEPALHDLARDFAGLGGPLGAEYVARRIAEALASEGRQRARWQTTFRYVEYDDGGGDPT